MTLSPPLVSMMTDELLIERYHRTPRPPGRPRREGGRPHAREDHQFHDLAQYLRLRAQSRAHRLPRPLLVEPPRPPSASTATRASWRSSPAGRPTGSSRSWTPSPRRCGPRCRWRPQHYRKHFDRDRRAASGCRSAATCRGRSASWREAGIRFSFLESHGLTDAHPRPRYGVMAPILSPGRSRVLRPGHGVLAPGLERGVGLPRRLRLPRVLQGHRLGAARRVPGRRRCPDGIRKNVGIKYYRVTGKVSLGEKQPYVPEWARGKAAQHAGHFLEGRINQVQHGRGAGWTSRRIVVSPYDAELFGHWWFEGPMFLDYLFRKMHFDQDVVKPITPPAVPGDVSRVRRGAAADVHLGREGLRRGLAQPEQRLDLPAPGDGRRAHGRAGAAVRDARATCERRALNQAARELLLAQASDWAFIMKTGTTVEYAKKRTRDHVARFTYLYRALTVRGDARGADRAGLRGARQHLSGGRLPRVSLISGGELTHHLGRRELPPETPLARRRCCAAPARPTVG